jgi:hypothetical protein
MPPSMPPMGTDDGAVTAGAEVETLSCVAMTP